MAKRMTLPDVGKVTREVSRGTSKEDFLARLAVTPVTPGKSVAETELIRKESEKFCIMPGHKQGYTVVTDPELIKQMGKKVA